MGLTNGLQMLVFGVVQKLKVVNNYSKGHKKIGLNERYVSKMQFREQGPSYKSWVSDTLIEILITFQTDRIRKAAAIKIQRYYRGYATRQKHKQRLRSEFDVIRSTYKKPSKVVKAQDALETKKLLISQLLAFFEVQHDGDRIVSKLILTKLKGIS